MNGLFFFINDTKRKIAHKEGNIRAMEQQINNLKNSKVQNKRTDREIENIKYQILCEKAQIQNLKKMIGEN